ncbi:YdcF family protein [Glutamicibacter bergerei]
MNILTLFNNVRHMGMARQFIAVSVLLLPVVALVWFLFISAMVLKPVSGPVRHVDAVVSLAPGQHRLPTALEYHESGMSENLVVSWFPQLISGAVVKPELGWLESQICRAPDVGSVFCFTPELDSTYGEALSVSNLVLAQDWDSVVVVTSRYHVFRTRFIFERTLPAHIHVNVVAAPTELSAKGWITHIGYENLATIKAIFQTW